MHANTPVNTRPITATLLLSLLFAAVISFSPLARAGLPNIGEPADAVISPQEESKLGASFYRALHQQKSILDDPEINSYIQSLGNRLSSGIGEQKFTFFVVKSNRVNAFAVPGGYIGINAGLILATRNEGELAGVVAHEIAHVTQRHIARLYSGVGSSTRWTKIGTALAAIALASQGQGDGAAAALYAGAAANYQSLINHTRSHELEADRVGIQYLAQAGFNPWDMAGFFDVMRNRSLEADKRFEILRTHPLSANRVAEAKARAAQMKAAPSISSKRYYLMKARLIAMLGRQDELLRHYKDKKQLSEIEHYTYALLLLRANQHQAAETALSKAQSHEPDNVHYQLARAQLLIAKQDYPGTSQVLSKLLQLYPQQLSSTLYYAENLKRLNRHKENIALIESFHRHHGDMPPKLFFLLAESYAKTNQAALSLFNQGQYYFLNGNYHAAGLQLKTAREKDTLGEKELKIIERLEEIIKEEKSAYSSLSALPPPSPGSVDVSPQRHK